MNDIVSIRKTRPFAPGSERNTGLGPDFGAASESFGAVGRFEGKKLV